MRRYHWSEVSGDKDCLQCAAVLGETSILQRTLKLLQGDDASVSFSCPVCGFRAVGVVAVDGSDITPAQVVQDLVTRKPTHNRPAIKDPLAAPEYKPPKTDDEAVRMAFGEVIDPDEFTRIVTSAFEPSVEIGEPGQPNYWRAELHVIPTPMRMGEVRTVDVQVEYIHATYGVVFSCRYPSTAGLPDIDKEMEAVRNSCLAVARPPTIAPARPNAAGVPRGPVGVQSNGWGSNASVISNGADPTRERLMSAFRGGG